MLVKIKKLHTDAVIPTYAKPGDAGLDLVATSFKDNTNQVTYGTGLSVEIPEGHVGLIYPRSSISKTGLTLANSVGVIDSGYRGELMLKFNYTGKWLEVGDNIIMREDPLYKLGDRVGQLIIVPYPKIEFVVTEELSDTERGAGGFGSSGS